MSIYCLYISTYHVVNPIDPIANHAPMGFLGPVRPGWTACALQLLARTDDALGLSYLVRREVPWITWIDSSTWKTQHL